MLYNNNNNIHVHTKGTPSFVETLRVPPMICAYYLHVRGTIASRTKPTQHTCLFISGRVFVAVLDRLFSPLRTRLRPQEFTKSCRGSIYFITYHIHIVIISENIISDEQAETKPITSKGNHRCGGNNILLQE